MAKKKRQEEAPQGSPAWMATFSDLMNLLLCFFVLLYSMSSIDAEKYEIIRASLNNSISILSGGGSAIEEGDLINSGVSQLNNLNEYTNVLGETSSSSEQQGNQQNDDILHGKDGIEGKEEGTSNSEATIEESLEVINEQKQYYTETMYDEISEMLEDKKVNSNYVDIYMDPDYNYVQLTIDGSILFKSGSAAIEEGALPTLSKVGDILKVYDDFLIEIEGHTDNVPITSNSTYRDNNWLSSARALNAAEYLIHKKGLDPTTLKYSGRGEYDPISSNDSESGREKNRRVEIKIYNQFYSY